MGQHTIKSLPDDERPYEKCLTYGPKALTDQELLAIILRTGTAGTSSVGLAREILGHSKRKAKLQGLYDLTVSELCQIRGVGKVKAAQVQCIAELSRRMAKANMGQKRAFSSAAEIAEYYMEDFRHLSQEQVMVLLFDTKGALLGDPIVSKGTATQSIISPRDIFLAALQYRAVYLILLHNHPSGDATPSPEDELLTKQVWEGGNLIGIALMDHIILGDCCYFSFHERHAAEK